MLVSVMTSVIGSDLQGRLVGAGGGGCEPERARHLVRHDGRQLAGAPAHPGPLSIFTVNNETYVCGTIW